MWCLWQRNSRRPETCRFKSRYDWCLPDTKQMKKENWDLIWDKCAGKFFYGQRIQESYLERTKPAASQWNVFSEFWLSACWSYLMSTHRNFYWDVSNNYCRDEIQHGRWSFRNSCRDFLTLLVQS